MSVSKPISYEPSKNSFLVSMKKFHVIKPDRKGYNKIYEFKRSKSYFFELADQHSNTNDLHLKIHTNDYRMNTTPLRYKSTSRLPNVKYQISKMLTHFFVLQQVLPRRIQQKYFQLIASKLVDRVNVIKSRDNNSSSSNRSTKTFFNFTYKKYRFHFGIYIPCNHAYNNTLPAPNNSWTHHSILPKSGTDLDYLEYFHHKRFCSVPSPFVMSNNRRACVMHQSVFFKELSASTLSNSPTTPSSKEKEGEKTFMKWRNRTINTVSSSRLGISYNKQVNANGNKYFLSHSKGFIYKMSFSDYKIKTDFKHSTLKKQERRRLSAANRIFRSNTDKAITDEKDRLFIARKHNFLYSPTQKILKPIHHLRYKNGLNTHPVASDYPYRVPSDYLRKVKGAMTEAHRPDSSSNTAITRSPQDDTAKVKGAMTEAHRPDSSSNTAITRSPQDDTATPPLSIDPLTRKITIDIPNWVALPPDVHVKEHYLPFIPQHPLYSRSRRTYYPPGSAQWYRHIKLAYNKHQEDIKYRKNLLLAQEALAAEESAAIYHGTSVNKYEWRQDKIKQLTQFQHKVHDKYSISKSKRRLKSKRYLPDRIPNLNYQRDRYGSGSDTTSDDTKLLESRPLKRDDTLEPRIHPSSSFISRKKSRVLPNGDDDNLDRKNL